MNYLLDVNALLALAVRQHTFHERTERWMFRVAQTGSSFASCAITELSFLRVILQGFYGTFTLAQAVEELQLLKSSRRYRFVFVDDNQGAGNLPAWVQRPKQLTDGHLIALAKAHGATLATLDEGIPGAFLIPH